jgi:tRNA A-37 threonylcarbamoyl transferase component Bud32
MLTALRSLPPVVLENVHVTTPYLYYYSPPSTQILEDYPGSTELKDYLCTHKPDGEGISRMGTALGAWLRGFHDWGAALEQQDLRDTLRENSWGKKLKAAITFGRLVETIDMFPSVLRDSKELFADVEKRAMREAEDPGGDLIHGDFWSGNILLRKGDIPGPRDSPLKLMIVDWELAHLGSRAVDLGQCLAELYLLWHFLDVEAGFQMIIRFLRGYGPVERDMALRICLSFGTHLVVWPCRVPHWERGQKMEDCVRYGAECVKYAWKGDVGWLGSEPLLSFCSPPST